MASSRFTSDQAGFTIIEMLIAIAIFSIGLMAVGALQARSLMETGDVARRTEAWTFVDEQAARLKVMPFYQPPPTPVGTVHPPDLVAGDHTLDVPLPPQIPRYTVHWRVRDNFPVGQADASLLTGVPAGNYTVCKQIAVVVTPLNGDRVADEIAQVQFVKTWAATGIPNPPGT